MVNRPKEEALSLTAGLHSPDDRNSIGKLRGTLASFTQSSSHEMLT